jgi:hypothetical protein
VQSSELQFFASNRQDAGAERRAVLRFASDLA